MKKIIFMASGLILAGCADHLPELKYADGSNRVPVNVRSVTPTAPAAPTKVLGKFGDSAAVPPAGARKEPVQANATKAAPEPTHAAGKTPGAADSALVPTGPGNVATTEPGGKNAAASTSIQTLADAPSGGKKKKQAKTATATKDKSVAKDSDKAAAAAQIQAKEGTIPESALKQADQQSPARQPASGAADIAAGGTQPAGISKPDTGGGALVIPNQGPATQVASTPEARHGCKRKIAAIINNLFPWSADGVSAY
jgi:hypothetical protein